jgi:hypothetical protein
MEKAWGRNLIEIRNIIQLPASNHKHRIYGHDKLLCFKHPNCMKIRMGHKPTEGRELIQLADSNHMHKTK